MKATGFWKRVEIGEPDNCWLWTGKHDLLGHGKVRPPLSRKCLLAHRVAYWLWHGTIPEQLCICHKCDNPSCVNPSHLWAGTHNDNMQDKHKMAKGRAANGIAKLTEDQVWAIRQMPASVSHSALGRAYGVGGNHIANIRRGKSWKHLSEAAA